MAIRVALFGQPRVVSEDGSVDFPLRRKTLDIFAYLILHRARPPTRDSLAFTLFPDDDEESARANLRRNLSYLLSSLPDGRQFVSADSERVAWNLDAPAHVDVIAFERAIAEGRDPDALAEYSGQLLPTIYDEWPATDRERLRDAFHEALARTIARQRSERRFDQATASAHRLLDEDPWREDVVRQLIAIRYEAGDRAGALAAFERFAQRLRDEMHTEPMAETVALRDGVLRGAPLATSEPPRTTPITQDSGLPFVGRDAGMQLARTRWHAAADGHCGMLFVSGEAGAGKSRFVTEFARLAESEGALVVRGYTAAGGEHRPYEAFVEALRDAPQLLDDHAGATLTDDRAARVRLFDSIRRRLSDLSKRRPVVLVLEDLHWAGPATISLLDFVAERLERSPVLIVATLRSDELSQAHALRALRRQLFSRGTVAEIVLERLSVEDATHAARAVLPPGVNESTLSRTVAWAAGVPLLLAEALRDLAAGRQSSAPTFDALIAERFARLSANGESALVFGAVLGERFDLATLAAATGWRDDELVDAIGESIEHGLVRATSRAPGLSFAFPHDPVRVAATNRVSESDRARAHALVARAMIALNEATDVRAGEIAHHLYAAGEPLRSAQYWSRAARYALDVFANDDARGAAGAGLALCKLDDAAQDRLRYDLVALREESLARIGALEERRADAKLLVELARDESSECAALERFFDAYRDDAPMRAEALAKLAALAQRSPQAVPTYDYAVAKDAFMTANYPAAAESAARAARGFDAACGARAAFGAACLHVTALARMGAFDEAADAIERLRPAVEASDDAAMLAEFHRVASSAANDERRDLAMADSRRSLELSLRIGDRYAEARARQNVAALAGKLGAFEEAFEQHTGALAAYRDVGDKTGIADTILNLSALNIFCGDYVEAERLVDEIAAQPSQARPWFVLRLKMTRGTLDAHIGRYESARAFLIDAIDQANALGAALHAVRTRLELATMLARQGRYDESRAHLQETIADLASLGQPSMESEAYALSARLLAVAGEAGASREHAEKAAQLAKTVSVQAYSEVAWNLATAYALLGDETAAMELAAESAAACVRDAMQMPAHLAETYLALPWHHDAIDYVLVFVSARCV